MPNKNILSVDPGFDRFGVAVLSGDGSNPVLLFSECISTDKKLPLEKRLLEIGDRLRKVIAKWKPEALSIETLFFNQNASSAMGVSQARGVALYEAARAGVTVFEYSPQAIKISVTGTGRADKLQVESMVERLVSIDRTQGKVLDDEIDAIAVGICHLATSPFKR